MVMRCQQNVTFFLGFKLLNSPALMQSQRLEPESNQKVKWREAANKTLKVFERPAVSQDMSRPQRAHNVNKICCRHKKSRPIVKFVFCRQDAQNAQSAVSLF